MDYRKVLIHGETEGQLDENDRYLHVEVKDGQILLHCEDDEVSTETALEVTEVLELIRSLTEAIGHAM